jgi:hypothetical protein
MRTSRAILTLAAALALAAPLAVAGCGGGQTGKPTAAQLKPGNLPEGGSWDGVYFNPVWGYLHLQHEGSSLNGRWKTADESAWGEMHGTVEGDIVRFEWAEHKVGLVGPSATRKGRGYFRYTRPSGENVDDRLIGEWGFDDAEVGGGEWDAVKQRNIKPDLKSIKAEGEVGVGSMK